MSNPPTLARMLGTTEHISPLIRKIGKLKLDAPALQILAIQRGCVYYHDGSPLPHLDLDENQLSNVELAIALLHPSLPYDPQSIRLGAAMLGAEGNAPAKIERLARMERCETLVRYVAACGRKFEPANAFWSDILTRLAAVPNPKASVLPHPTRFVAMTGFTRRGPELVTQWIRPGHATSVLHG